MHPIRLVEAITRSHWLISQNELSIPDLLRARELLRLLPTALPEPELEVTRFEFTSYIDKRLAALLEKTTNSQEAIWQNLDATKSALAALATYPKTRYSKYVADNLALIGRATGADQVCIAADLIFALWYVLLALISLNDFTATTLEVWQEDNCERFAGLLVPSSWMVIIRSIPDYLPSKNTIAEIVQTLNPPGCAAAARDLLCGVLLLQQLFKAMPDRVIAWCDLSGYSLRINQETIDRMTIQAISLLMTHNREIQTIQKKDNQSYCCTVSAQIHSDLWDVCLSPHMASCCVAVGEKLLRRGKSLINGDLSGRHFVFLD
ncbi:MAG: hypothetical protein HC879_18645 [Leptolyngbyaceae cyanobacterium SL_5_9]|nr:hypothetical protein [Leptolyngbyaceae cyanobacterium SL_5_9]NJO76342.1 hypothetical protein [Leptolyngbyaceae cyanobacterium RM1_406_9]